MGNTTYIFNQPGFIPGVKGIFSSGTVTVDDQGNVLATNGIPSAAQLTSTVPLVSPPANTTANVDTPVSFVEAVNHVEIQNSSSYDLFVAYGAVATQGSLRLPPNSILLDDVSVTIVHLLTAGTTAINGNAQPNIYVGGTL